MGVDHSTHTLYLPAAELPPGAGQRRPTPKPDTFMIVESGSSRPGFPLRTHCISSHAETRQVAAQSLSLLRLFSPSCRTSCATNQVHRTHSARGFIGIGDR